MFDVNKIICGRYCFRKMKRQCPKKRKRSDKCTHIPPNTIALITNINKTNSLMFRNVLRLLITQYTARHTGIYILYHPLISIAHQSITSKSNNNIFIYKLYQTWLRLCRCLIVNLPHSKPSPSEYLLYIVNLSPGYFTI